MHATNSPASGYKDKKKKIVRRTNGSAFRIPVAWSLAMASISSLQAIAVLASQLASSLSRELSILHILVGLSKLAPVRSICIYSSGFMNSFNGIYF